MQDRGADEGALEADESSLASRQRETVAAAGTLIFILVSLAC